MVKSIYSPSTLIVASSDSSAVLRSVVNNHRQPHVPAVSCHVHRHISNRLNHGVMPRVEAQPRLLNPRRTPLHTPVQHRLVFLVSALQLSQEHIMRLLGQVAPAGQLPRYLDSVVRA